MVIICHAENQMDTNVIQLSALGHMWLKDDARGSKKEIHGRWTCNNGDPHAHATYSSSKGRKQIHGCTRNLMKNLSSITMANGWVGERVMFFRVCSLFLPFLRQLMHYRNLCISDKTPPIFNAITSFRLFQKTIGNWDSQQFTRYRIMICGGWWYGVPDKQTDRQPVSPNCASRKGRNHRVTRILLSNPEGDC